MTADTSEDDTVTPEQGNDRLGSMAKAIDIMETVAELPVPTSASTIAEQLRYAKPTAHRIVAGLRDFGLIEREIGNGGLIEGDRLVRLAINVLNSNSSRGPRRIILRNLVERIGETSNIGVLADGEVLYIDRVESHWPLNLRIEPGRRVPIYCTAIGKTLLSQLPKRSLARYLTALDLKMHTETTITSIDTLQRELDEIRANGGLAFDDQEYLSGVVCVSVPIHNAKGRVIAALGVSAPGARWDVETARTHVPAMLDAAARLGKVFSV